MQASRYKVLLVDDDPTVRSSLARALREENFEVAATANGDEALTRLLDGYFDIVLLDLNMPVKNGWDAFERITAINPLLPVIFVTARPDQYELARAAGASALMEKPVELPELFAVMEKLLVEPPENRLRRLTGSSPAIHYRQQ